MNPNIQTAVEIFNSEVLPALEKWNYTVTLSASDPTYAVWELRWGDWAPRIVVKWGKKMVISSDLYRSVDDPKTVNSEVILQRFNGAVEAIIALFCRLELSRMCFLPRSKGVVRLVHWKTKPEVVEWVTKEYLYRCTLSVSLSKHRPIWRWVCERGEFNPFSPSPMSPLCEITPEETVNPTEALLKFVKAVVIDAFL
jgi:hypothetical protein